MRGKRRSIIACKRQPRASFIISPPATSRIGKFDRIANTGSSPVGVTGAQNIRRYRALVTALILAPARRCRRRGDPLAVLSPHLFDQRLEVRHAIHRRDEDRVTNRDHGDILEADGRH